MAYFNIPKPALAAPSIAFSPSSGVPGVFVAVSGSGFSISDSTCVLVTPNPVIGSAGACTVSSGALSASFTVGGVAAGSYVVQAKGDTGDSASATFIVTGPAITPSPSSGSAGDTVSLSGAGFAVGDTACTIGGGIVTSPTCNISNGVLAGTFFLVSGSATPGPYTISVTGTLHGDSASTTFTVTGPKITLNPTFGNTGITVSISGSGFVLTDAGGCTISGSIVTPVGCTITSSGTLTGTSFTVTSGSVPGTYTVTVTGSTGDFAQASFTVTSPSPTITLSPNIGVAGTVVTVTGSGFNPTDTCANLFDSIVTAAVCTISSGSLTLTSFTVSGTASPGTYTIQVQGSTLDLAAASFTVIGPTITLNPTSGSTGTTVSISGSGFKLSDAGACTISSSIATPIACTITGSGTLTVTSFTVKATATPGTYAVTVTGSSGDFATASFTVIGPAITLNPPSGPFNTPVTITGSGFNTLDAGACIISSSPTNIIAGGATCSITGSGQLTGTSFVVSSSTVGTYTIKVLGSTGDFATATFTITSPAPTIVLNPNSGPDGTPVTVSGVGFNPSDTCSTISSTPTNIISSPSCTISGGQITSASFTVAATALAGTYTVKVTGSTGDFAQTTFVVTGPKITLTPNSGPVGIAVTITGSGFFTTDTCATISSSPTNIISSPICTLTGGSLVGTHFTVSSSAAPGTYTVIVTGSTASDFATATFTITSTSPTITLIPTSGPFNTLVTITGSGFNTADSGFCTSISSSPTNIIAGGATCSITASGQLTGAGFTVSGTTPGSYIIKVTGSTGDFATATFTITGPTITLSPAGGPAGIAVTVTASSFAPTDTAISFTSSPGGLFVGTPSCIISPAGSGTCTASVTTSVSASGSYTVTGTGDKAADTAKASFTIITSGMIITPIIGPPGSLVSFAGVIQVGNEATCSVGGGSGSGISVSTSSCAIISKTSTTSSFSGSFVVGNLNPGTYTVRVTGSGGGGGSGPNYVEATFTLISPTITLTPSSGPIGITVAISGSGFSFADNTCSLAVTQGSGTVLQNGACGVSGGTGKPFGGFLVGNVAQGTYKIRVTGNTGDFAEATFIVTLPSASLQLFSTQGAVGSTISFRGTGFSVADSGCVVQSLNGATPDNSLLGSFSCSMSSGVATGSFVVGALATSEKNWVVQVKGTPANDIPASASFTVIPAVAVSPTTGTSGTVVSVTGSGFSSTATSCTLTLVPSAGFTVTGCAVFGTSGDTSGSFTVGSAVAGLYFASITDNQGHTAGASFQVGAPSANLDVTPNIVAPGFSGALSGNGFNPQDTSCTLTPSIFSSSSCSVSAGVVAGSFTVAGGTTPGLYVVTVTGNKGDFASNFLEVPTVTLTTTTISTTSSLSSTTSFSTTFTQVNSFATLTTTTFTWTGVSTQTFYSYTTQTVSGESTYYITSASASTSTITAYATTRTFTESTTLTTGPYAIAPAISTGNNTDESAIGLLATILLLAGIAIRRELQ